MKLSRKESSKKLNAVTIYNTEDYWGTVGQGITSMPQQAPSGGQPSGGGGGLFGPIVAYIAAQFIPEKDRKKKR